MRWIKRLLLLAMFMLLTAIIGAGVGWHLMHGQPDWYQPHAMLPAEREQAAIRAEDKVAEAREVVTLFHARERLNDHATNPAGQNHPEPIQLAITADELNALFLKWAEFYNWQERYGDSLADPMLHLHRGRIILAGTFIDIQSVVSLHYEPRMQEDGQLEMKLHRVLAGRLPLPQTLWNRGRDSLTRSLNRRLPALWQEARIAPDGSSNEQTMQAAFSQLLLQILHQQPADPVIFIPLDTNRIPVRLSDVRVEGQTLHVTLHPLTRSQREQFLRDLRQDRTLAAAPEP